jgi:hypothetical protein
MIGRRVKTGLRGHDETKADPSNPRINQTPVTYSLRSRIIHSGGERAGSVSSQKLGQPQRSTDGRFPSDLVRMDRRNWTVAVHVQVTPATLIRRSTVSSFVAGGPTE